VTKSTSAKRFSLDADVLVYAADRSMPDKHERAKLIVMAAPQLDCWLTIQALGEFFFLTTRKRIVSPSDATAQVNDWLNLFQTAGAGAPTIRAALPHATDRRLAFWDAMLLATANEVGCELVLSEDMHDGMRFGNLTVRNPFVGPELAEDIRQLIGLDG
jgi:predicted nucleic acid-binding protein